MGATGGGRIQASATEIPGPPPPRADRRGRQSGVSAVGPSRLGPGTSRTRVPNSGGPAPWPIKGHGRTATKKHLSIRLSGGRRCGGDAFQRSAHFPHPDGPSGLAAQGKQDPGNTLSTNTNPGTTTIRWPYEVFLRTPPRREKQKGSGCRLRGALFSGGPPWGRGGGSSKTARPTEGGRSQEPGGQVCGRLRGGGPTGALPAVIRFRGRLFHGGGTGNSFLFRLLRSPPGKEKKPKAPTRGGAGTRDRLFRRGHRGFWAVSPV